MPARIKELGVPPTPSQTGSGFCSGRGINSLSGEWRAVFARPVNVRVLADVQKQIEFLGKERIVVLELQPEQGKRFDE